MLYPCICSGDLSENNEGNIRSNPDAGEFITSFRIPLSEFDDKMRSFEDAGCIICLSVWCYGLGIQSQKNKTEYCKQNPPFSILTTFAVVVVIVASILFILNVRIRAK